MMYAHLYADKISKNTENEREIYHPCDKSAVMQSESQPWYVLLSTEHESWHGDWCGCFCLVGQGLGTIAEFSFNKVPSESAFSVCKYGQLLVSLSHLLSLLSGASDWSPTCLNGISYCFTSWPVISFFWYQPEYSRLHQQYVQEKGHVHALPVFHQ